MSRKNKSKQFLPIVSEKTMIEETIDRLSPQVPLSSIYTIANPEKTEIIKKLLPNLPDENLLIEPTAKNTAPSLVLATARIYLQNPKAILAALPADHLIKDSSLFLQKLKAAATAASSGNNLITFGIPPLYPSTGYGYIQFSTENPSHSLDEPFYTVREFKEKPNLNDLHPICFPIGQKSRMP
jgi:mannose-1-phosphate guanylyltransferase